MYSIQTQVSRLRIGHTGLNKSKTFMSKHPTGLCDWCGGGETLEEFRKKGEYDIIIMKYLLKGGISELLY